jgi:hypothetical protein
MFRSASFITDAHQAGHPAAECIVVPVLTVGTNIHSVLAASMRQLSYWVTCSAAAAYCCKFGLSVSVLVTRLLRLHRVDASSQPTIYATVGIAYVGLRTAVRL